jgi:hypothetical protein
VPDKSAITSSGSLDASKDPGHTFVYLKDDKGNLAQVSSFGPDHEMQTTSDEKNFVEGSKPGDPKWPVGGQVNTWEWNITPGQLSTGVKAINDFQAHPPNYSPDCQCTVCVPSSTTG